MNSTHKPTAKFACYFGDRKSGQLAIVDIASDLSSKISRVASAPASGRSALEKPILTGTTPEALVNLLDPKTKQLTAQSTLPVDSFPAHVYRDPNTGIDWYMNDGEKETGNDTLNCGQNGSSVTAIAGSGTTHAQFLATICVGRGHHQAAFTAPSSNAPDVPRRAFISNLKDGTLSVIGTDASESDNYLKCIATIDLCEPEKEADSTTTIPNNSFPHGLVYSPITGKIYNLNNGYGTVAIIDPVTLMIEKRIPFQGHSNLFIAADGRYVIGRGADRKSDPNHVIAKLSVLDVTTLEVLDTINLPDIYISKYYFNSDHSKLYLTTSVSGSPEQQRNVKSGVVVVLDMRTLPKLSVSAELQLGQVNGLAFAPSQGEPLLTVASDSNGGDLVILDGKSDQTLTRISVHEPCEYTRIWTAID